MNSALTAANVKQVYDFINNYTEYEYTYYFEYCMDDDTKKEMYECYEFFYNENDGQYLTFNEFFACFNFDFFDRMRDLFTDFQVSRRLNFEDIYSFDNGIERAYKIYNSKFNDLKYSDFEAVITANSVYSWIEQDWIENKQPFLRQHSGQKYETESDDDSESESDSEYETESEDETDSDDEETAEMKRQAQLEEMDESASEPSTPGMDDIEPEETQMEREINIFDKNLIAQNPVFQKCYETNAKWLDELNEKYLLLQKIKNSYKNNNNSYINSLYYLNKENIYQILEQYCFVN